MGRILGYLWCKAPTNTQKCGDSPRQFLKTQNIITALFIDPQVLKITLNSRAETQLDQNITYNRWDGINTQ